MDKIETPDVWLAKKYFDECSLMGRTAWDQYLKFYSLFMTVNGAAIGLTIQYIHSTNGKTVISIAFFVHNLVSAAVAVAIGNYSRKTAKRMETLALFVSRSATDSALSMAPALTESPFPGELAFRAALAAMSAHLVFAAVWVAVPFVSFSRL